MATFILTDSMFWLFLALIFGLIIGGAYLWISFIVKLAKKHLWVYKLETILVLLFPTGVVIMVFTFLLIPLGNS